jgi:hypothetical protein
MKYQIGDVVQWVLGTATGEAIFIGHPNTAKNNKVLVLATAALVGIEIDAKDCRPTGISYPSMGGEYRQRYLQEFPGKLKGNL